LFAEKEKRKRRARLSPQPVTISKAVLEEALKPLQIAVERAEQQLAHMQRRIDNVPNGQGNKATPFYGLFEQLGVAIVFAVVQAILLAYFLRR
jgi:NADH:ubiquinone oxidoreductase subunit 6 (subunit J)